MKEDFHIAKNKVVELPLRYSQPNFERMAFIKILNATGIIIDITQENKTQKVFFFFFSLSFKFCLNSFH